MKLFLFVKLFFLISLTYAVREDGESSKKKDRKVQDSDCSLVLQSSLIDKIPMDSLIKIFEHLNLSSLLMCRLVNKKFKDVVNSVEIKRLSIDGEKKIESNYLSDPVSRELPGNLLTLFPLLEELHCHSIKTQTARNLLLDKERLKRKDFNLFYYGIKINSVEDLNEYIEEYYLTLLEVRTDLIARKYSETDLFHFITVIYYDHLIQSLYSENKESFSKKFFQVDRIVVSEAVPDIEQFIELIKSFKYIKKLEIRFSLQSSFYDQIPDLVPFLNLLVIDKEFKKLNLNFIFKLKELEFIEIYNQPVSSSFIRTAFEELKNLRQFEFLVNKKYFNIENRFQEGGCLKKNFFIGYEINIFDERYRRLYENKFDTINELIDDLDNQILNLNN